MTVYGTPDYNTEVMLLGRGTYDLQSGHVELLIWVQVRNAKEFCISFVPL